MPPSFFACSCESAYKMTKTRNFLARLRLTAARGNMNAENQLHLHRLYRDLLDHDAEPAGVGFFSFLLEAGASRTQIAGILTSSNEYRTLQIERFYADYLHRKPGANEI